MSNFQQSLLRIATAGSVDDGKSTLIGRLLYESNAILDDQLEALQKSKKQGGILDLSLVTDGLKSEREQGITIDVAYKYFASKRRKFILADAPGHVQYTRNMVTAASRADAAIILVDARHGVQEQTRRHAYLVHLLSVQHIILAINKIDLIAFDKSRIDAIEKEFRELGWNKGHQTLHVIPLSALRGDNISERSADTPWYQGQSLLALLESLPVARNEDENDEPQLPVQLVVRNNSGRRYATGTLLGGKLKVGDSVRILPSNQLSVVADILRAGEVSAEAGHGDALAVRLEDERDLERGSLIVKAAYHPDPVQTFAADLVWFDEEKFRPQDRYILRLGTQTSRATIDQLNYRFDLESLTAVETDTIEKNDIVRVSIESSLPLYLSRFGENKSAGAFILIDPLSFRTVAAGMVESLRDAGTQSKGMIEVVPALSSSPKDQLVQLPQSFLYANTTPISLRLIDDLISRGINVHLEASAKAEELYQILVKDVGRTFERRITNLH